MKENSMLLEVQKREMQNLLLDTLQKKDFSTDSLENIEQNIHSIIILPYADKIREIAQEASELAKDMHCMLGKRHEDISSIAAKIDVDMASGADPREMLIDLRGALKDVMLQMAEDAETLLTLSQQDGLTGLANRRSFDAFLQEAVEAWKDKQVPVSLIMMDIDYFKQVNDNFGHQAGDQVLQTLAGQIKTSVQPLVNEGSNILAARYGGEEFAIILCGEAASRAGVLAEVLRKVASKIVVTPSDDERGGEIDKLSLSVSFGVASLWEGWKGTSPSDLVAFADKALYRAKSNGRNCTVQHTPESKTRYTVVTF